MGKLLSNTVVHNADCKDKEGGILFFGAFSEVLSLLAVMQYVSYRFLQSTMFPFVYTESYKYITFVLLIFACVLRFYSLIKTQELTWNHKSKYKYIAIVIISILFFFVGWKHDYKHMIFLPICGMCLYKISIHKVLRWFTWTVGVLLFATIICSLSGAVRNLTYSSWKDSVYSAYGVINTTDFASYFTYLLLFYWCTQKYHDLSTNVIYILICCGTVLAIYTITDSRTFLCCGIITIVLVAWNCLEERVLIKNTKYQRASQRIKYISILLLPILGLLFIILMLFYVNQEPWAIQVNQQVSGRLEATLENYNQYGIHAFGSNIESMHGNGGTVIRQWGEGTSYLDVSFAMMTIRYGWIVTCIMVSLWCWMTFRAYQNGCKRIALTMTIIAFHALSESRFLDINFNILLVVPLCSFENKKEMGINNLTGCQEKILSSKWVERILAIIILVLIGVLLPRIISWLRTIFFLDGWTKGIHTFWALCISICGILQFVSFWKTLSLLFIKKTREIIILTICLIIIMTISVYMGNNVIQKGMIDREQQLKEEEDIINLIQSVAIQPVYAAELSEIYGRRFIGFKDHISTTEELYRSPKGTIFVDKDTESVDTVYYGGLYVQISEWSGVYSFDQNVIDKLTDSGYEWKRYYDRERCCDLKDLAIRNGLERNDEGRLILHGRQNSIQNNLEWDQYGGDYEVRYQVALCGNITKNEEEIICWLQVMGESGERVIKEQGIALKDFDHNGICNITIPYSIRLTPKVSYLILVEDDVSLFVDEIAWRKVV